MMTVRKNQARGRHHRAYRPLALWISLAAVLAVMSACIILWVIQRPAQPSITVVSSVIHSAGDETYQPGTDREYIIVEVQVTNPTLQPFNFAPVVQTYLTDDKGNRYDMAPVELSHPIAAGAVAPGATIRGQLSYNVKKIVGRLTFHAVTDDVYRISYAQPL